MGIVGELLTIISSAIGVYQVIYALWTWCEVEELGKAIVSKADTTVAWILTVIIVLVLTLMRWIDTLN